MKPVNELFSTLLGPLLALFLSLFLLLFQNPVSRAAPASNVYQIYFVFECSKGERYALVLKLFRNLYGRISLCLQL